MCWKSFGGGGWCVIGEPQEYTGENDDVLQPFLISGECRSIPLLTKTEQLPLLKVGLVTNGKDNNPDNDSTNDDLGDISEI